MLRSLPHRHVAAALGNVRELGIDRPLSQAGQQLKREAALCVAMMSSVSSNGLQSGNEDSAQ